MGGEEGREGEDGVVNEAHGWRRVKGAQNINIHSCIQDLVVPRQIYARHVLMDVVH